VSALETPPAWPVELPPHLSASQLAMFARCPEQYRRRHVLRQKERCGAAMLIGGVDHKTHEHNFRQKITTRQDVPLAELEDVYASVFDKKIDEEGGESEIAWGDDNYSRAKDQGIKLVRAYHEHVSPLVERKTTTSATSQPKGHWKIQGLVYRAAKRSPLEWHLSVKTAETQVITPESPPPPNAKKGHKGFGGLKLPYEDGCEEWTNRYIGRIARDLHAAFLMYGPDHPWRGALDHEWACGRCSYRKDCAWWSS
jgi:hypothetical protein